MPREHLVVIEGLDEQDVVIRERVPANETQSLTEWRGCGAERGDYEGAVEYLPPGHPEMEEERAEREREAEERRVEQRALLDRLAGKAVLSVSVNDGFSLTVAFADGTLLVAKLVGGEMDGHFDPPGNRSLSVEVMPPPTAQNGPTS